MKKNTNLRSKKKKEIKNQAQIFQLKRLNPFQCLKSNPIKEKLRLTSKLTAPLWSVSNALNRKCAYVVESEMLKREQFSQHFNIQHKNSIACPSASPSQENFLYLL